MRIDLCLPCNTTPNKFIDLVTAAEDTGFEAVWLADMGLLQHDVFVYLTLAALHTKKIWLGACVHHPFVRHPAITLNGIASVNTISHGRAAFGIGIGSGHVVRPLGLRAGKVAEMREILVSSRQLMSGETVTNRNPLAQLVQAQISNDRIRPMPLFLAATGPKMLSLGGELADGVFAHVGLDPIVLETARSYYESGASSKQNFTDTPTFSPFVHGSINAKRNVAQGECHRGALNMLLRGKRYLPLLETTTKELDEIRNHSKVSPRLVEALTFSGTVDDCARQLDRISSIGIDHLTLYAVGNTPHLMIDAFQNGLMAHAKTL